jgi:hypothetical protein
MSPRRLEWVFSVLLLIPGAIANAAPTREQVEAVLVFKFAQFVQWAPESDVRSSAIVVGLLGSDAIRPALEEILQTRTLRGRRFEIKVYRRPEEVRDCEILVVDVLESRRALVLKALPRKGLLTIGEGASFTRQGGVIGVILDGERVGFDLNLAAAEEAGLTIDATLLGLAREAGRW